MSTAPPPADDTPRRRWLRRRADAATADGAEPGEAAAPAEDAQGTEVVPAPPRPEGPRQLRRRRERLLTEREETVYHLGGLAFELYRRDQLSDEVMRLRAGHVAQIDDAVRDIDARLSDVERERRERRVRTTADPSAGCCLTCRASFRAEARFCWQCGARLVPDTVGDEQPTVAIPTPPTA
jgi:hypothetical protein